jgi:hypothetical protein
MKVKYPFSPEVHVEFTLVALLMSARDGTTEFMHNNYCTVWYSDTLLGNREQNNPDSRLADDMFVTYSVEMQLT